MSRTSQTNSNRVPSPVKFYINFNQDGEFVYYDAEKKERVSLGSDLDFLVMDTRSAVGGFNKALDARIYSNMVKSVVTEEVTVKCGKETIDKGIWAEIKDRVKAKGAKFCTKVFALAKINGTLEPVELDFMGSAIGDWMSFIEELGGKWATYSSTISATKGEERKSGKNIYYGVAFSLKPLDPADNDAANAFNDDKLQPYLNAGVAQEAAVV